MIKYSAKVFLLSVFALFFTSSKGMEITALETEEDAALNVTSNMAIENLVSEKNVSYESNFFESSSEASIVSESFIKEGPFKGWAFKQEVFPFVTEKYWAECFIEGCSEKFGSEIEDLSKAALMHHLCEHLNNDDFRILVRKEMGLTCEDPIFSVAIDKLPTVLLCKGSKGLYYCYMCNNCKTVKAYAQRESKLQNEWKRHSLSCYKPIINNILKENENKLAKKCCNVTENIRFHAVGVHARYIERKVTSMMDVNSILNKDE